MTHILSSITVSEVMTSRVVTLGVDTTLEEAMEIVIQYGNYLYPVMEEQHMAGTVTYEDLLEAAKTLPGETPVREMTTDEVPSIAMDRTLRDAARLMAHEEIGRLLVVDQDDSDHLIGILSRSDVLQAYAKEIAGRDDA
ncbi:MAG: CBS domain-containing protein [Solirubrobacterales bacterium]